MNDAVRFDQKGDYHIGEPLQDMNVQHAKEKDEGPAPMQHVHLHQPPAPPQVQPTVKPRGGFNLNALRQKAGISQPSTPAPIQEESKKEPEAAPIAEVKPVPAEPVVEPEVKVEEVAASMPAAEPQAETPEEAAELQKESAKVPSAPVEEQAKEAPKFNLSSLGQVKSEAVEHTGGNATGEGLASLGLKQMDLSATPATAPVEEAPKEEPVAQTEGVAPTEGATVTEEEAMTFADETPFEVTDMSSLLRIVHASQDYTASWVSRVLRDMSRRPTDVFVSKAYENLRAYSAVQAMGKTNLVYITLGVGKKITTVAYDSKRKSIADASSEISVSGTCAIVQEMPVASCSQRSKAAVAL